MQDQGLICKLQTLWRDEHYVESCVNPLLTKSMDDSDLLAILNAGGESIVDALLYLVSSKGPNLSAPLFERILTSTRPRE